MIQTDKLPAYADRTLRLFIRDSVHTYGITLNKKDEKMLSNIQADALALHKKGLNVFPVMLSDMYGNTNCMKAILKVVRRGRMIEDYIEQAFAGRCHIGIMTGPSSGGLFVVRARSDMYHNLLYKAKKAGIRVWAIPTDTGGELWFRTDSLIRTVKIEEGVTVKAKDLYEKGQEFVRLPETYRDGQFEAPEPPFIPQWKMEKLGLKMAYQHYPDPPDPTTIDPEVWFEQLPKYAQKLILEKGLEPNPDNPETRAAIELARQPHRERYRNRIRHYAGISAYMAEHWDWSSPKANSDLATLAALIQIAEQVNTNTVSFHASQRRISQYAHLAENTVALALKRFMQGPQPILGRVEHAYTGDISYNFNRKLVTAGKNLMQKWDENEAYSNSIYRVLTHAADTPDYWYWIQSYPDLLEKGALEYIGLLIHALLSQKARGVKQAEMVEHLHFSESVIKRQCRRLEELGLLIHGTEALYYAVPLSDELCHSVITQAGVAGKSEKRLLNHIRKSQDYIGSRIVKLRQRCDKKNMDLAYAES